MNKSWNCLRQLVLSAIVCALFVVTGADTALAQEATFSITVRDQLSRLVQGATVTLDFTGETSSKVTGADGSVVFTEAGSGSYSVAVVKSGYQFDPTTGEVNGGNPDPTIEIVGQAPSITISGTVKKHNGDPLPSPTLTFNGNQTVSIDSETGAFSIDVTYGTEYTLTIDDPEWFFTDAESSGTVYGDIEINKVGFPK